MEFLKILLHFIFLGLSLVYGIPFVINYTKKGVVSSKNLLFTCIGLAGLISWYVYLILF
jgi:hypothetical protein